MKSILMEHWSAEQRELPGMNCIAFANGDIIILDIRKIYDPNNNEHKMYCTPLCDTTIDSVEKYNHDCWTMVDVWASVDFRGGKIVGGDGQMGNEGFIACVDHEDQLVWAIFLEDTNPIKKLSVNDNKLIAINEHEDLRMEMDLQNVVDIKMTCLD
ncbi:hypothetical protein PAECIP112173_02911 [Paenibacillus sp. JJ-100]|uniref:hypothetical protein n=1 Tax=Paenibacillus sp. JJ-100 TaxID=2974896 RepID=UPI0022FFB6DF|nr:hypothetical protein [Paenibacillus sp. JJ-100]CAI6080511.1 hypothetical protein PAECIP112173_02911 [Paenibacillus sp. JJ-100]